MWLSPDTHQAFRRVTIVSSLTGFAAIWVCSAVDALLSACSRRRGTRRSTGRISQRATSLGTAQTTDVGDDAARQRHVDRLVDPHHVALGLQGADGVLRRRAPERNRGSTAAKPSAPAASAPATAAVVANFFMVSPWLGPAAGRVPVDDQRRRSDSALLGERGDCVEIRVSCRRADRRTRADTAQFRIPPAARPRRARRRPCYTHCA